MRPAKLAQNNPPFDPAPAFEDFTPALRAIADQPAAIVKEARQIVALARAFNREVIQPSAAALDRQMAEDPDYLPWSFVQTANEWGFYTLFVPKLFGGRGYNLSCVNLFLEELASGCLAMANLVGVHYLGYTMLTASWNMRLLSKISRQIVTSEKQGEPCLLSLAMTEPDAGTDSQNIELMNHGNLRCLAEKVPGGYRLNGTKIFISCGHLSTWQVVHAYTDADKASENTVMLLVHKDSPGFCLGKKEHKMGQKGCPASELIFKDCFVPDDLVCIDNAQIQALKRDAAQTNAQIFAYIWGASRAAVGAFGIGAARGAYEAALRFANETALNGAPLINQQWCQGLLAQMYANVAVCRSACHEATQANAMHGLWKTLNRKPLYYAARLLPAAWAGALLEKICRMRIVTTVSRILNFDLQAEAEIDQVDGWGSMVKVAGTNAGMRNCQLALELMGQAGLRHDRGAEKIFRDARLLQIYEGTNEVNRVNVFKRLIQRSCPQAVSFSQTNG
ncbi:MAG: acyl-CoA/acyl-ACP dehydrogenase [Desulfobacterales bacterium]|nr:acyl-CoA/acyl-ACP dehydrogenase [Desulfobacterales bacterium]